MLSELPNLDDEVSFVVDGGTSVGPIPMREIIASVGNGQRDPSVLVWWAGATDWIRFDVHDTLMSLTIETGVSPLQAVPDVVAPTPEIFEPAPEVFEPAVLEPAEPEPIAEPAAESRWSVPAEPEEPEVFTSATLESVPTESPEPETFEPVASTPHREPAGLTPQEQLAAAPIAAEPVDESAAPASDDAFSFNLPVREASEVSEPVGKATITGLFSSGSRSDGENSVGAPTPSPAALDAILAARTSLESVGARIEALSSATKRSLTAEEIQSGVEEFAEPSAASVAVDESTPVAEATAEPAAAGSWTPVADDVTAAPVEVSDVNAARAELTSRFEEMVAQSVEHQRRIEWVTRVDELLLSACITSIADSGYVAMDLSSRESDHRVLFEHNNDSRRVRLDLAPLENVAEHLGRHVKFGLSWGRDVSNPDGAFDIVRQQNADELVPPGVVTCEADIADSSVSTHVDLILAADDFVKQDYGVDRSSLDSSIAATLHALEERWHVLFDVVSGL